MDPLTSARSNEKRSRMEATVTDVRNCYWLQFPEDQRKQIDWLIPFKSLTQLREEVAEKIRQNPHNQYHESFLICTTDKIEITELNFNKLKKNDSLLVMDPGQKGLPFNYEESFSNVPHTRAVTDQQGTYYGDSWHNPAAFALAELIDNALSATKFNIDGRKIEIRIYEAGDNSSVQVLDNGHGMNSEALKSGLKYKAPKEDRGFSSSTHFANNTIPSSLNPLLEEDEQDEEVHPLFINSCISKFGAGLKQAVFWLGSDVRIMTKTEDSTEVRECRSSKDILERYEKNQDEDPWKVCVKQGKIGEIRDPECSPFVKNLILTTESGKLQFTHIAIEKLEHLDSLLLPKKNILDESPTPTVEKQLAHIYHYYLHGRNGNIQHQAKRSNQLNPVEIIVNRFDSKGQLSLFTNLADLPSNDIDLESAFVRSATDVYRFVVQVSDWKGNSDESYKIGGIIRYHPYHWGKETNPVRDISRKSQPMTSSVQHGGDDDCIILENENEPQQPGTSSSAAGASPPSSSSALASSSTAPVEKCGNFFHIWWNGRLIPLTLLESFDWCSPPKRRNAYGSSLIKCYERLSGSLFFDSHVGVITDNKLNVSASATLINMFNENKKIGGKEATTCKVVIDNDSGKLKITRVPKIQGDFEKWLGECHRKYDKEVSYFLPFPVLDPRTGESNKIKYKQKSFTQYEKAVWEIEVESGDVIKLVDPTGKKGIGGAELGRVISFLVDDEDCSAASNVEATGETDTENDPNNPARSNNGAKIASLSWFRVELVPTPLYGPYGEKDDRCKILRMSNIDTTIKPEEIQKLLDKQNKELYLQTKVEKRIFYESEAKLIPINAREAKFDVALSIDSGLFKLLQLEIFKIYGNKESPKGKLNSNSKKIPITIIFRVHRLAEADNNGIVRELMHTGDLCEWKKWPSGDEGYFFKKLDFGVLKLTEPGKYVITFRSYIDMIVTKEQNRSRSRSRIPTTNYVADVVEKPYEEEWGLPVDTLGRKILESNGKLIRLPYYSIYFTIKPGVATGFEFEQVGNDDSPGLDVLIGQKFPIKLKFLDARKNKTSPPENFKESNLSFLFATVKSIPSLDLKCNVHPENMCIIENGLLLIKDVEITGCLGKHAWKQGLKLEGRMNLNGKLAQCFPYPNAIVRVGRPAKLRIANTLVEVENGHRPEIICEAMDCYDNIVELLQPESKPIRLDCEFFQIHSTGLVKVVETEDNHILASSNKKPRKTDNPIYLEELESPNINVIGLQCRISYENCPFAEVFVRVLPSKDAVILKIGYQNCRSINNEEELVEINNENDFLCIVGEKFKLVHKLFDARGNQVEFNEEIHKLETIWFNKHSICDNGTLPEYFEVEKMVKIKEEITTKLIQTLSDGSVKELVHNFYLTSKPLEPNGIQAFLRTSSSTDQEDTSSQQHEISLDKQFGYIIVTVFDKYRNQINQLDLDENTIYGTRIESNDILVADPMPISSQHTGMENDVNDAVDAEESNVGSFLVKFAVPDSIGQKEIQIAYENLPPAIVTFNVVPGKAAGLAFLIDGTLIANSREIKQVQNMTTIKLGLLLVDSSKNAAIVANEETKIRLRLMDGKSFSWNKIGNRGGWKDGIREIILKPNQSEGNLGNLLIGVPERSRIQTTTTKSCCNQPCFQELLLRANVIDSTAMNSAAAFICKFHITPRTNYPSWLEISNQQRPFKYSAGAKFEYLTVQLFGEDGMKIISSAGVEEEEEPRSSTVTLKLMEETGSNRRGKVYNIPATANEAGNYEFVEIDVPTRIGTYHTKFIFNKNAVKFEQDDFNDLIITSGETTTLSPEVESGTHGFVRNECVSSNSADVSRRAIITGMKLILKDQYGNLINDSTRPNLVFESTTTTNDQDQQQQQQMRPDLTGIIKIHLYNDLGIENIPIIEKQQEILGKSFPILNGQAIIPKLILRQNVNVENNTKFTLEFIGTLMDESEFSFIHEFIVLNDARLRQEMQSLQNTARSLTMQLTEAQNNSTAIIQEEQQLQNSLNAAKSQELGYKRQLRAQYNGEITDLPTIQHVNHLETKIQEEIGLIESRRRRFETNIPHSRFEDGQIVLGPIGTLMALLSENSAVEPEIADERLQNVISWHLQSHLNSIAVRTRQRGIELNDMCRRLRREQAFMLLDLLRDRPAYNETIQPQLQRFGHPVYVRSLIVSTQQQFNADVNKICNQLIGSTILVDTLEDATNFMAEFNRINQNQNRNCPTILTRDGNRLTSNATVGGRGNSAPRNVALRIGVAISPQLARLQSALGVLGEVKRAIRDTNRARQALDEFVQNNQERKTQLLGEIQQLTEHLAEITNQVEMKKAEYNQSQQQSQQQQLSSRSRSMSVASGQSAGSPMRMTLRNNRGGDDGSVVNGSLEDLTSGTPPTPKRRRQSPRI